MSSIMNSAKVTIAAAMILLLVGCQTTDVETTAPDPVRSRLDASVIEAARESEQRGDFATAAAYYRQAYDRDPKSFEMALGLSRSLRRMSRPNEAIVIAERSLEIHKRNPKLMAELGKSQLAKNDTLAAIDTLSRAGSLLPDDWEIQSALGVGYDRVAMYEQAARRYEQALKIVPSNAVVLNNYALSLAQDGKLEKAIELLEKASAMPESNARIRQNLALLYAASGNLKAAERLVRRDLEPETAAANMEYYRRLSTGEGGQRMPKFAPAPNSAGPQSQLQVMPDDQRTRDRVDTGANANSLPAQPVTPVRRASAVPSVPDASIDSSSESTARVRANASPSAATPTSSVTPVAPSSARSFASPPAASPVATEIPKASSSGETATLPSTTASEEEKAEDVAMGRGVPSVGVSASSRRLERRGGLVQRARLSRAPTLPAGQVDQAGTDSETNALQGASTASSLATAAPAAASGTDTEFASVSDNAPAVADNIPATADERSSASSSDQGSATSDGSRTSSGAGLIALAKASNDSEGVGTSPYRVQLGSYRSEAAANAGIAILRAAHEDILGPLNLGVKSVILPEVGEYFRVLTAPLASRVAASDLCRELESREVNCLVSRQR